MKKDKSIEKKAIYICPVCKSTKFNNISSYICDNVINIQKKKSGKAIELRVCTQCGVVLHPKAYQLKAEETIERKNEAKIIPIFAKEIIDSLKRKGENELAKKLTKIAKSGKLPDLDFS